MNFIERLLKSIRLTVTSLKKRHRRQMRSLEAIRWAVLESLELRMMMSTLYWNPSTQSGLHAGNGTWDTTSFNWSTTTAGTDHVKWSANSDAIFWANGTSTITLSGTQSANSVTFQGTGYTITGGTSLTLTGTATITANATATINSKIGGSAGLTKAGSASLIFSGSVANIYSGGTTVSAGTLQLGGSSTLGSTSGSLTISSGAIVDLNGTSQTVSTLGGTGTVLNNGGGAYTLTISGGNMTGTFGGVISDHTSGNGTVALMKSGSGTQVLSGVDTYSGGTTMNAGTLQLGNDSALGANSAALTMNGGIVDLSGYNPSIGSLSGGAGKIADNASNGCSTLTLTGSGNFTYSGTIVDSSNGSGGTVALNMSGISTMVLLGNNTYSGSTTIADGLLQLGNGSTSGTLGGGSIILTNADAVLSVNHYNTLTLSNLISGNGSVIQNGAGMLVLTANNSYAGGTTVNAGTMQLGDWTAGGLAGTGNISLAANASLVLRRTDTYELDNVISGAGNLSKFAGGTVILTGNNTYTGGTTIDYGTLQLSGNGTLGATTASLCVDHSGNDVGTLDLHGANLTVGSLTGGRGIIVNNTSGTTSYLTVGAGDSSGNFGGTLGSANGTLAFTKIGAGTQVLTGSNSYAGGTVINGGVLNINYDSALGGWSGGVTFSGNGTLQAGSANVTVNSSRGISINSNVTATIDTQTNNLTITSVISGSGTLRKVGSGNLTLTANNTYGGGTVLTSGLVDITSGSALGTDGITFAGNATLQAGVANLILSSAHGITLSAGTVGTFDTQSNAMTISGVITGAGGLNKAGSGNLSLAASNTYTGGTTINGGTLNINSDEALGGSGSGITFSGNGTLQIGASGIVLNSSRTITVNNGVTATVDTQSSTTTIQGAIAGTGTLIKMGSGDVLLPGIVVASINLAGTSPTTAASGYVDYTVTFTTPVTGVDVNDFATTGMAGASVYSVTAVSGTTYTVRVSTGAGDGILGLNLVDNKSIVAAAGSPLGGFGQGDGNFTGTAFYTINRIPLAVSLLLDPAKKQFSTSTPTLSGVGNIVVGDPTTVSIKIYTGSTPTGSPIQTLAATMDSSGSFSATADTLTQGQYCSIAEETDNAGNIGQSLPTTFEVALDPPSAPAGLNTDPTDSTLVNLSWSAPDPNDLVTGYDIYISNDGGATFPTSPSQHIDGNVTSYQVTGLMPLTKYGFEVAAENKAGSSSLSDPTTAWTPDGLKAPTDLQYSLDFQANYSPDAFATITWTNPSSNEGGVIDTVVEVKEPGDTNFQRTFNPIHEYNNKPAVTLDLDKGATYTVRIQVMGLGSQAYSDPIEVDVPYSSSTNDPSFVSPVIIQHPGQAATLGWPNNDGPQYPIVLIRNSASTPFPAEWGYNDLGYGYFPWLSAPTEAAVYDADNPSQPYHLFLPSGDYSLPSPTVTAERDSNNTFLLSWDASSDQNISYRVVSLYGINGLISQTRDSAVVTSGIYAVYASDTGLSLFSNIIDLYPPTMGSDQIYASAISATAVRVVWDDRSFNETGYEVQRAYACPICGECDESTWETVGIVGADVTEFVDNNLKPDETYYYRVAAKRDIPDVDSTPIYSGFAYTYAVKMPALSDSPPCEKNNLLQSLAGDGSSPQEDSNDGITNTGGLTVSVGDISSNAGITVGGSTFVTNGVSNLGSGLNFGQIPTIECLHNGDFVVRNSAMTLYFGPDGDYEPRAGNPFSMSSDNQTGDLVISDDSGDQVWLTDPAPGTSGKFIQYCDSAGNGFTASWNGDQLSGITQNLAGNNTESMNYTYGTSGASDGLVTSIGLFKNDNSTPVQKLSYVYYVDNNDLHGIDPNGSPGSLEATITTDSSGTLQSVSYMRYYKDTNGDRVKYIVEGDSYNRLALAANISTPTNFSDAATVDNWQWALRGISDSLVAQYADHYYEYNSAGQVTKHRTQENGCSGCTGGFGTATYAYFASNNLDDYNSWKYRTTETPAGFDSDHPDNPQNTQIITYSNYLGQTILKVTKQTMTGGQTWIDYYRYDDAGRQILHANPLAVTSYDESLPDLVGYDESTGDYTYLSNNSGLIEYTDYDDNGYKTDTAISQGDGGGMPTLHYQSEITYDSHSVGGSYYSYVTSTTDFSGDLTVNPCWASSAQLANAGARTTQYTYTWVKDGDGNDTNQVQSTITTLPTVSGANNGSGSQTYNDAFGRTIWTMDADGYVNYTEYDPLTGAVTKTITDVDSTTLQGLNSNDREKIAFANTGWTLHGSGLNLVTTYTVDTQGRTIEVTDPKGNHSYTLYDDADHATFSFAGGSESLDANGNGTLTTTGPIQMNRTDLGYSYTKNGTTFSGTYDEDLTFSGTLTVSDYKIDLPAFLSSGNGNLLDLNGSASPQFTVQSLSRSLFNTAGQMIESDSYVAITNSVYLGTNSNNPYSGTSGTNYYATTYDYDARGNQARIISPTGTITVTTYDVMDRAVGTYIGTNDTPSTDCNGSGTINWEDFIYGVNANATNIPVGTDMTLLSLNQYDNGSIGDSNLTQTTSYTSVSATPRVTQYLYDWRDRQIATGNAASITYTNRDNLGEATSSFTYTTSGNASLSDFAGVSAITINNDAASVDATSLRAYATVQYDEQGRSFRSSTFSVNPANGSISSSAIVSNTWYDARGNVIESQTSGSAATKSSYDGAGRVTAAYTTDGGAVNNNGTPLTSWSAASSVANDVVLEQTEYLYDADGNVLLTTARQRFHDAGSTAGALGTPTSGIHARVSYALSYYDIAGRTTATVNIGTNGGVTPDVNALLANVPLRSDNALVTSYTYNAAGEVDTVTNAANVTAKTFYDNLGRTLFTVADWDGSYDPTGGNLPPAVGGNVTHINQTTGYTYDGDGHTLTMTAVLPTGQNSQTTQYVYGVTTSSGSAINSNDILGLVKYPDPTTGAASSSSSAQNSFTFDALGETLTKTDQNGTLHTYSYDALGRLTSDVVSFPSGNTQNVNISILRIDTSYNSQGLVDTVTSYSDVDGAANHIVNQVQNVYNGLGQLTVQYQSHNGAVDMNSTPKVGYAYDSLDKGSRLISMTYPNGNVLSYSYGATGSLNDTISRLDSLVDGNQTVESYQYLGLSTVVIRSHPEDGVDLTYVKQSGDANGDAGDQYTGLDRFGRVVDQRWINSGSGVSVDRYQYTYDRDSNVLTKSNVLNTALNESYTYDNLDRLVSSDRNNGTTNDQSWNLDAVGNMNSVSTGNSTTGRTYDSQNELQTVGNATLSYDHNGNTLTDDQGHTLIYDAWNRLVKVHNGNVTLATYSYDGLGHRITEAPGIGNANELYYSSQWQVIEERVDVAGLALRAQYVWSPVYVNAMVLRDYNFSLNGGSAVSDRTYALQDANYNVTSLVHLYTLPGDATGEGNVTTADLTIWADHYNTYTTNGPRDGDFNDDGFVSGADYTIWADHNHQSHAASWQVVEHVVYGAYGKCVVTDGNWNSTVNNQPYTDYLDWSYLYQGGRFDTSTGLYTFQERVYSVSMMRWVQQDPLGYIDGMSMYSFVADNPINRVDPLGLLKIVTDWTSVEALEHWKSGGAEAIEIKEGPFIKLIRESAAIRTWLADVARSIDSEMRNKIIPDMKSKNEWIRKYGVVHFPPPGALSFDSNMPTIDRWLAMGKIHHTLDAYGTVWRVRANSGPKAQGSLDAFKVLTSSVPEKTSASGAKPDDCKDTFYWDVTLAVHGFDTYHSFATSGRFVSGLMVGIGAVLNAINPVMWSTHMIPMPYNINWEWNEDIGGSAQ